MKTRKVTRNESERAFYIRAKFITTQSEWRSLYIITERYDNNEPAEISDLSILRNLIEKYNL